MTTNTGTTFHIRVPLLATVLPRTGATAGVRRRKPCTPASSCPIQRHWATRSDDAHQQMQQWVSDTIANKQFGVFISGQSLFTKAIGKIAGAAGDYELPNYDDYGRILLCLQRL